MNEQERARHVQDMVLAEHAGETIVYTGSNQMFDSAPLRVNMTSLIEHPERYSIKKNVRFVNIYDKHLYQFTTKDDAEAAAENSDCLVVAHPIELPPVPE